MNAVSGNEVRMPKLVAIIELKWLLAGEGVYLHVERLMSDPDYARRALERAQISDNSTLRAAAERVRCNLGLVAG
jgi:hypothetical protein